MGRRRSGEQHTQTTEASSNTAPKLTFLSRLLTDSTEHDPSLIASPPTTAINLAKPQQLQLQLSAEPQRCRATTRTVSCPLSPHHPSSTPARSPPTPSHPPAHPVQPAPAHPPDSTPHNAQTSAEAAAQHPAPPTRAEPDAAAAAHPAARLAPRPARQTSSVAPPSPAAAPEPRARPALPTRAGCSARRR